MKHLKTFTATIFITFLEGCASYTAPVAIPEAKINPQKLATARENSASWVATARLFEEIAQANAEICSEKGPRVPFMAFANPREKDPEMRAAYLIAGYTEKPKLVWTDAGAKPYDGKFIEKVGTEQLKPGEAGRAFWLSYIQAKAKKPIVLVFSDGTTGTLRATEGCTGLTITDTKVRAPENLGEGIEVLPALWPAVAENRDEALFLAGRSLYFTSDEGQRKLHNGMLAGAAISGVLKSVTFGLSPLLGDVKASATNLVRGRYLTEADAFGLAAAIRAGANPEKVLAGVRRMSKDAILPWSELKFGDGRLPALERLVAALPVMTPAVASAAVAPGLETPAATPTAPAMPVTLAVQPEKSVFSLDVTTPPAAPAKTSLPDTSHH